MIKGLLIYINIIFLSAISFFTAGEVTVSASVPTTAKPGETFEIALTVNKGDLMSFSKLQYDIPAGATATPVDSKGGDFKVSNNVVKINWTGLPHESTFTVKFKVTTSTETSGIVPLTGKFAYTSNGEVKEVFFTQSNINFGNASATANTPSNNTTTTATTSTTAVAQNNTAASNTTAAATANNQSSNSITAKRVLSATTVANGGSFMVEITVTKNDITGYAKIQDNLPAGFTAEEVDSYGGLFTVEDGKAKILWTTMPSATVFKVKYKVNVDNTVKGKQKIDGFFSYLPDQNADTKITIATSEITVGEAATAVNNNSPTTTNTAAANSTTTNTATTNTTNTPSANTANNTTAAANNAATTNNSTKTENNTTAASANTTSNTSNTASTESNNSSNTDSTQTSTQPKETAVVKVIEKEKPSATSTTSSTSTPKKTKTAKEPSTKVSSTPEVINNPGATNNNQELFYSVQICALKRAVDVSYFEKNHAMKQKIYVQMHEGWHKYTVGEFGVYKEARDYRETVKTENKIVGPFVTAYNKGIRITVQEALMISKQQWVQ